MGVFIHTKTASITAHVIPAETSAMRSRALFFAPRVARYAITGTAINNAQQQRLRAMSFMPAFYPTGGSVWRRDFRRPSDSVFREWRRPPAGTPLPTAGRSQPDMLDATSVENLLGSANTSCETQIGRHWKSKIIGETKHQPNRENGHSMKYGSRMYPKRDRIGRSAISLRKRCLRNLGVRSKARWMALSDGNGRRPNVR